jgi:hypothetical protein
LEAVTKAVSKALHQVDGSGLGGERHGEACGRNGNVPTEFDAQAAMNVA